MSSLNVSDTSCGGLATKGRNESKDRPHSRGKYKSHERLQSVAPAGQM